MYSYSCLVPGEGIWPPLQPFTYTYLSGPLLLPPIQTHNFCSPPPALSSSNWTASREYHCFHGPGALPGAVPPWWAFPQAYPASLSTPFPAPGYLEPLLQSPAAAGTVLSESWTQWPEGGSLQVELRWGRVERALGPRLELPDFVLRELRRAYGTFPRTDVRVTFSGGEFLLQAAPRVREPEYRVQRRLLRAPASGDSSDDSPPGEAAERRGRKKRKGLG